MNEHKLRHFNKTQIKNIDFRQMSKYPIYEKQIGHGCVSESYDMVKRNVDLKDIQIQEKGLVLNSNKTHNFNLIHSDGRILKHEECYSFDHKGLIYRIDLEPGAYEITVHFERLEEKPLVTISGLDGIRTRQIGHWNAAKTMPKFYADCWRAFTWHYGYVTANDHIHLEVEPTAEGQSFVIESIVIERLDKVDKPQRPQLFLLGDSTVMNYVFEELPMNGWGQHFPKFFDLSKVDIINYSEGGRSLKRMYVEGRLNDLLIQSNPGDYIFLQSGHNDEKEEVCGNENEGFSSRFGRGATEDAYERTLERIFLPLFKLCGLKPIFVTPMTRLSGELKEGDKIVNSFERLKFPEVMKKVAQRHDIPLVDLNSESIDYLNSIGVEAAKSISLYLEAGESPAKMSAGSFANGNPNSSPDGTHFKEALAKQYARIIVKQLFNLASESKMVKEVMSFIKKDIYVLLEHGQSAAIYKEVAIDCISGINARYRNQIEKSVQLGLFELDEHGFFNPNEAVTAKEVFDALIQLGKLNKCEITFSQEVIEKHYGQTITALLLTRELLAYLIFEFYNKVIKALEPLPYNREGYAPLYEFNEVLDQNKIAPIFYEAVQSVWTLGFMRSEVDNYRGLIAHGRYFEPRRLITRALCAKYFYFIWALMQKELDENHKI